MKKRRRRKKKQQAKPLARRKEWTARESDHLGETSGLKDEEDKGEKEGEETSIVHKKIPATGRPDHGGGTDVGKVNVTTANNFALLHDESSDLVGDLGAIKNPP